MSEEPILMMDIFDRGPRIWTFGYGKCPFCGRAIMTYIHYKTHEQIETKYCSSCEDDYSIAKFMENIDNGETSK